MTTWETEEGADDFRDLVAPHVSELHRHCYRMLGSVDDADEVLQETLLAAWQGLSGFEGRASPRTWLFRIATNRCLNAIRDGKRRPPLVPAPPFEPPWPTEHHRATWIQPYPTPDPAQAHERREHIELAFVSALQLLPPRQCAALLLVDVLGFSLSEAADLLGSGATAVKGLLQRARAGVEGRREEVERPSPSAQNAVAERFASAFSADDIDGVLALLTDRAWLAMPPAPHLYRGHDAIGAFLEASIAWRRGSRVVSLTPLRANAAPGFAVRLSGPDGWQPGGVIVLELVLDGILGITRFLGESGLPHRRLPVL